MFNLLFAFDGTLQPGGQLVQFRAGLIHGPGQLGEIHFNLPKFAVDMGRGGFKGAHQDLLLGAEQLHRLLKLSHSRGFQVGGPLPGFALDGTDALPELGIGLGVGPEGVCLLL